MSGVITNIDQLDLAHGLYTYADYIHWQLKERLEILKGKIFKMRLNGQKCCSKVVQSLILSTFAAI